jgi:single-stranded-DNA-specific exonuclease
VASRDELDDALSKLLPPSGLLGIAQAASLLADAIQNNQPICIVADYDCDGATACAVGLRGLKLLGAKQADFLVPDRVVDGYGLTPPIADRVKATGADLLVTVDNGIASVDGVARAKELGLTVIVTDHHLPIAESPLADAIVNPNQIGCTFASKAMAGVGVMFYVLLATRAELRSRGVWTINSPEPKLDGLLPLVALGTVADVVKLDANNRRLVSQGLRRIRGGQLPIGMAALFAAAGRKAHAATTFDFGFALGPRINAAGRLADMRLGIECLLTDDPARANELALMLDRINKERRDIEGGMRDQALEIASHLIDATQNATGIPSALAVFDETFHEGVVGIVASRLKDQWHRPTFVFAPSGAAGKANELKGSGRSIPGFHLRDALDLVAKQHPDVLLRFGGHAMAAGCTIDAAHFERFGAALQAVATAWLDKETLQRRLLTDGSLPASECRVDVAETLNREVWGQGFAAPIFLDTVQVLSQRIVGEKHLALKLQHQGLAVDAIWFNRTEPLEATASLAYRLEADEWNGVKRVKWMVEASAN